MIPQPGIHTLLQPFLRNTSADLGPAEGGRGDAYLFHDEVTKETVCPLTPGPLAL